LRSSAFSTARAILTLCWSLAIPHREQSRLGADADPTARVEERTSARETESGRLAEGKRGALDTEDPWMRRLNINYLSIFIPVALVLRYGWHGSQLYLMK
jgi:hypothetical protein